MFNKVSTSRLYYRLKDKAFSVLTMSNNANTKPMMGRVQSEYAYCVVFFVSVSIYRYENPFY